MIGIAVSAISIFFVDAASIEPPTWDQLCDHFSVLSDQGDTDAQIELANCYVRGVGRPQDFKKAESLLRQAVETNSPLAANNLAALILFKKGDQDDYPEAIDLLKAAIDAGAVPAATNLGIAYINGLGVPASNREGIKWLTFAADEGNELANLILYAAFEFGLLGVESDASAAYHRWNRFAGSFDRYPDAYFEEYLLNIQTDEILGGFLFSDAQLRSISQDAMSRVGSGE